MNAVLGYALAALIIITIATIISVIWVHLLDKDAVERGFRKSETPSDKERTESHE